MARFILCYLFILILVAFATGQENANLHGTTIDDARFDRICKAIQAKLDKSLTNTKIPGATVSFVTADGRRASFASGFRNQERSSPMQPSDSMFAGSIGKTFVAAVTLQMAGEGTLNLDEKIEHWLGQRPWFSKLPNARDITLRNLLNHSSGIPNHVEEKSFLNAAFKRSGEDIEFEDLLAFIHGKKPLFAAGQGYYYSDTDYILIGLIVERVTGNTLYDEVSRRLLKPLGLVNTYPTNTNAVPIVSGYYQGKPTFKNGKYLINPQWEWAGGGFGSTTGDLALWAKNLYGGEVLSKPLLKSMVESTSLGDGKNYGLGVEINHGKWGISYGHDGEFPGYLSDMRYYPKYGIALAVEINADEMEGCARFMDTAADDLAKVIIDEITEQKLSEADIRQYSNIAMTWIKLVDAEKFSDSWDGISAELKTKHSRETWQSALQPFIRKAGKIKTRILKSVVSTEPGVVSVDFESSFSKVKIAIETVTLVLEKDGKWRISGYSIS